MITSLDATAQLALQFQAQQLRIIGERLSYVRALLPLESIDWRGPAQQRFEEGVLEIHRDLARNRALIESIESRTMNAASQMSARVG
ncbi:hypothetical protein ADILRU_2646 [Leifsonia rubra CMS 76R]|nr:hypothetical protein ADILRU_2646 [Leifsonia rubra CMS 76R]